MKVSERAYAVLLQPMRRSLQREACFHRFREALEDRVHDLLSCFAMNAVSASSALLSASMMSRNLIMAAS